jgi:hypothetical protein
LRHARPFCHPSGLAAGQLYDERSKIPANCALTRSMALVHQVFAGNHLGYDQPRAQLMSYAAEWQVCYT